MLYYMRCRLTSYNRLEKVFQKSIKIYLNSEYLVNLKTRRDIMYAIIETGGKQVRVEVGQKIYVEKLEAKVGDVVTFEKVLLVGDKKAKVGAPYVEGAAVTAKVEKQGLSRKIRVFKYKSKANERKTIGHRQPYTCLVIESIK